MLLLILENPLVQESCLQIIVSTFLSQKWMFHSTVSFLTDHYCINFSWLAVSAMGVLCLNRRRRRTTWDASTRLNSIKPLLP